MHIDRVLFVDDDLITLELLWVMFHNRFHIQTASNGPDGIAAIRDSGPFSIVVADLCMPDLHGLDVLGKAKELSPRTVRILMTACVDPDGLVKLIGDVDLFGCIPKPIDFKSTLTVLENGIKKYANGIPYISRLDAPSFTSSSAG